MCNTHRNSEEVIKSLGNTRKITKGTGIQSRSIAEAVRRYEHQTKHKIQE